MSTRKWLWLLVICSMSAVIGDIEAEPPHIGETNQSPTVKGWRDTPQQYMRLHHRLSLSSSNWPISPEEIGDSGDAFTLFLMKRRIQKNKIPVEAALRKGIIERIEKRRGLNPDQLRVDEAEFLLSNAIYQDMLFCNPTQQVMINWLQKQFREQVGNPKMQIQLIKLRDEMRLVVSKNSLDEDELSWFPAEQMRKFLDELLSVERVPAPSQKP